MRLSLSSAFIYLMIGLISIILRTYDYAIKYKFVDYIINQYQISSACNFNINFLLRNHQKKCLYIFVNRFCEYWKKLQKKQWKSAKIKLKSANYHHLYTSYTCIILTPSLPDLYFPSLTFYFLLSPIWVLFCLLNIVRGMSAQFRRTKPC